MKFPELPFEVRLGLFLFSKGNEIVEFGKDQIDQSVEFAKQRYLDGKAFVEKLIDDYEGSVFASTEVALANELVSVKSDNVDFAARIADMNDDAFGQMLIDMAISEPEKLLEAVERFGATSLELCHIPDDFVMGAAANGSIAYHVPTGEDRERFDELTRAGEGEVICVLDTGTTPGHPDLSEPLFVWSEVPGEDGIDRNFHGTHCIGSACGSPEISLAHKARYGSVQVLSARGSGQSNWIARGLKRAREWRGPNGERVTIISISIGGGGADPATERELELCDAAGIIVIAAAGNDGWRRGADTVNNPGRSENTIAEGAIDERENRAGFSSGGPLIDAVSPGVNVVSADYRGGRTTSNGTSMATPVEASKAACVQSFLQYHGFARLRGTSEYREFLKSHARDIFDPGHDDGTGHGILDVFETLLKQKPDNVEGLASALPSSASKIAQWAAILICVASMFCGTAMAQDSPKPAPALVVTTIDVETIAETVERKTTFVGESKLGVTEKTVKESISTRKALSLDYGPQPKLVTAYAAGDFTPVIPFALADDPTIYVLDAKPGKYLVVADLENGATNVRPVAIEGPEKPPVEPIPDPPPSIDNDRISSVAAELAGKMSDQPTRTAMAKGYELAMQQAAGKDLVTAKAIVKKYILDNVMFRRRGDSAFKDWSRGFQQPLEAEFKSLGVYESGKTEAYFEALKATIDGLNRTDTSPNRVVQPPQRYYSPTTIYR